MTHPIYTYGYSGHTPDMLAAYLEATGAQLLDIRFRPYSRQVGWSGDALKRRFGGLYRWLECLGNINYNNDRPITLKQPDWAVPIVRDLLIVRPVILLCVCAYVTKCHRLVAAEYLKDALGAPVDHLPGQFDRWVQRTHRQANLLAGIEAPDKEC